MPFGICPTTCVSSLEGDWHLSRQPAQGQCRSTTFSGGQYVNRLCESSFQCSLILGAKRTGKGNLINSAAEWPNRKLFWPAACMSSLVYNCSTWCKYKIRFASVQTSDHESANFLPDASHRTSLRNADCSAAMVREGYSPRHPAKRTVSQHEFVFLRASRLENQQAAVVLVAEPGSAITTMEPRDVLVASPFTMFCNVEQPHVTPRNLWHTSCIRSEPLHPSSLLSAEHARQRF